MSHKNASRLLAAIPLLIFVACCGLQHSAKAEFEESLSGYNDSLCRHDMLMAKNYLEDSLVENYMAKVYAAQDVRIVDCRVLWTRYDEAKGEAEARVEVEYYTVSTQRVKTVLDTQRWAYTAIKGKRQWRLTSLLPEFR
jgi:hypothetical protein